MADSSTEGVQVENDWLESLVATQTQFKTIDIGCLVSSLNSVVPLRQDIFEPWTRTLVSLALPGHLGHFADIGAFRRLLYDSLKLESLHIRHIWGLSTRPDPPSDYELMARFFDSTVSSLLTINSLILTGISLSDFMPCFRRFSQGALTTLHLNQCSDIDEFATDLVRMGLQGKPLKLKSLSYTCADDTLDGSENDDAEAFVRLLTCCEPLSLQRVSFDSILYREHWPIIFGAIISQGANLRFLEVSTEFGFMRHLITDHVDIEAITAVAQKLRALEEVALPLHLELSDMSPENGALGDFGHVILEFVTLPNIKAVRLAARMGANFRNDDGPVLWSERECKGRAEQVMSDLASYFTRAAALNRADDTKVPLFGFGDESGVHARIIDDEYDMSWDIDWETPLFYKYLGGRKDRNGSWTRRWYPAEEENGRDFTVFVPDRKGHRREGFSVDRE